MEPMRPRQATTTAFVLAGGSSRRMGRDKALLPWGERTLLEHMICLLRNITTDVRVVGRDALPDMRPGEGPIEGLRTALATTTADVNLVVAVDLPFLEVRLLDRILRQLDSTPRHLVLCQSGGQIPLCLGAKKSLLADIENYRNRGGRSLRGLSKAVDAEMITEQDLADLGLDRTLFRNINTPEEYRNAFAARFTEDSPISSQPPETV